MNSHTSKSSAHAQHSCLCFPPTQLTFSINQHFAKCAMPAPLIHIAAVLHRREGLVKLPWQKHVLNPGIHTGRREMVDFPPPPPPPPPLKIPPPFLISTCIIIRLFLKHKQHKVTNVAATRYASVICILAVVIAYCFLGGGSPPPPFRKIPC